MADINLKQYLSRLDQHLQDGAFDEALYHSRHILKYFPKNIAAYRVLGRALLEEGRWQQAGEVLRRVLSVEPDNFDAFVGLSQVYERLKRPEEAIWYLERAFEQRPNSQALTRKLRDMYAEHYNRHVEKINLTAGAVARQYKSNGLYDQALDVLQRNLQRYPNRADLRILMARVYREAERPIEAAEVAQDLLEQLPDCLEANVLLAKVWLAVDRPSDAQRHISRIEPVAPYVALEIVQGGVPDEDAFMVPELDYQAVAARELASSSPDWLNSLEESEEMDVTFDMPEEVSADVTTEDDGDIAAWLRDNDSGTGLDEDDDWLSEVESMDTKVNEAPTMPIPPPKAQRERTGLTGLLAALEGDEEAEQPQPDDTEISDDDFADLFDDLDDVPSSALADELRVDGIDLFADFEESDETINGEALDLFGDDDFALEESDGDDDPMAWLQESGIEFIEDFDDEDTVKGSTLDSSQLPSSDTADPMAWLKDSGVELVESSDEFDAFLNEVDDLQDPEQGADPMAWLKNSGVEIIEESPSDEVDLFGDLDSGLLKDPTIQRDEDDDEDPMAWLKDSGVELADEDAQALATETPLSSDPEDELDWLADDELLDEMLDIESFTSEEGFAVEEIISSEGEDFGGDSTESPEGQNEMTENEFPDDWFDEESSEEWAGEQQPIYQLSESEDDDEEDALDWMSDVQVEADAFTADTPQSTDDLFGESDDEDAEDVVEPALFGDMENGLSWESGSVSMSAGDDEDDDDLPNWLVQDEEDVEDEAPVAFTAVGEDAEDEPFGFDLDSEDDEEDGVVETTGEEAADWLSSLSMDDEESEEEDLFGEALADGSEIPIGSADEERPEWLMNNSPNFADGDDEEFSWELDSEEDDVPESTGEGVPDWLASVGDSFDDSEEDAEASEEDILAFGSESGLSEDEEADFAWDGEDADEEDSASEGMPDWLAASAPDFGEGEDDEEFAEEEWEAEDDAEETPAWLSAVGEDSEEDEEPEAASEGMPAWLSASAPEFGEGEDEEEFEEEVVAFGTGQSFGEDDDEEFAWEAEEAESEGAPEWLSAVGEATQEDEEDSFDDEFLGLEAEQEAEAGGVPDWLSASAPEFGAGEDDEDFEEDDDDAFSWGDDEKVESLEEAAPEWLSAVGGLDEAEEEEEVAEAGGVPDWLSASAPEFGEGEDEEDYAADVVAFGADEDFGEEDESYEEETPEWLASTAEDEEEIEGVVAYGAGEISPLDEDEYEEPVAFGAGDTVDEYGNEWETEEDDEDYEDAVPDWLSASAVEQDVVENDELLEDYEDNIVSFGAEDTILQDAQESGESLPLAEAPPLDDELPVDDWEEEEVRYSASSGGYTEESVPLGDALPVQEDEYTESFAAAGMSNLLYEESRAGILDEESREYEAEAREFERASVQPQSLNYDTIDEDQFVDESEEIEAVPADNAPDWLNTMVPGLDIDFEAAEDAPIETEYADDFSMHRRDEFVSTGGATRQGTDLEWLTDIVDEETSQPPTLPGDDYLPAEDLPDEDDDFALMPEPQTRRRFVFTRPPLWLRRNKTQAQTVQEERPDDFDFDDDMDEIGEDLPPWLDYDDDEF